MSVPIRVDGLTNCVQRRDDDIVIDHPAQHQYLPASPFLHGYTRTTPLRPC